MAARPRSTPSLAAFDRVVAQGSDGTRAGVRLFRHRQILAGQRAAQGAGPAARPLCRRQVRPVQARHPLCDAGPGLPEPGPSDPGQERCGAEPLARRAAGGARPERPAHGQSDPGACRSSSASSRRFPTSRRRTAQNRFQLVFRRFLGVFARPEHPLALFLDDLQWLDAATLDLIEHLVTAPGGAAPAADRRLSRQRGRSRASAGADAGRRSAKPGRDVQEIVLAPLAPGDVERLLADALHTRAGARAAAWPSWCSRRPPAIRSSRSSSSSRWPRRGC